jgi:hypothetical protein
LRSHLEENRASQKGSMPQDCGIMTARGGCVFDARHLQSKGGEMGRIGKNQKGRQPRRPLIIFESLDL